MVNNLIEIWYWTLMLGGIVAFAIWRTICFVQYLWNAYKARKKEQNTF